MLQVNNYMKYLLMILIKSKLAGKMMLAKGVVAKLQSQNQLS